MTKAVQPITNPVRWQAPLALALVAILVRAPFMPQKGFPEDQTLFAAWAEISRDGSEIAPPGGLDRLYAPRNDGTGKRFSNYPPGYLLILQGMAKVYDVLSPDGEKLSRQTIGGIQKGEKSPAIDRAIWVLKIPAVLADAAIAALLCLWISRRIDSRAGLVAGALYALAPPVIFDSAVWGQVESVFMLPLIVALECAARGRLAPAAFWASIAVLIKAQAIMFAPLFLIFGVVVAGPDIRRWGSAALAALIPFVVAILLFGGETTGIADAYLGAASYYPFTHLNGFSLWFVFDPLLAPSLETMASTYSRDSAPLLGPATPKNIAAAAVLLSWTFIAVKLWKRKCEGDAIGWAARLLPLCFFALSTQMHERYLVPAIAAWLWAYANNRRWWGGFIAISAVSLVNLLWAWPGFGDTAWTRFASSALHTPWLGLAPGQWCATAVIVVAALVTLECAAPAAPKKETTKGEVTEA